MRACLPPVWLLFTCCVPVWPTLSLWPPEKTLNFLFEILAELFKRRTDLDTALCVAYRLSTVLLSQVYTVWGLHLLFAYRSRQRNVCGLSAPRCVSVCVCVGICVCVLQVRSCCRACGHCYCKNIFSTCKYIFISEIGNIFYSCKTNHCNLPNWICCLLCRKLNISEMPKIS